MDFPESVVINGVTYSVELVEDSMDSDEEYGRINFSRREIRIQDQGDSVINHQTLMHEIMHGLSYHFGLSLDDTDEKHEAMDVLASVLVDTLTRSDILLIED